MLHINRKLRVLKDFIREECNILKQFSQLWFKLCFKDKRLILEAKGDV